MRVLSPGCKSRHPGTVSLVGTPACTAFEVDKLALSRLVLAAQLLLLGVQPFPRQESMPLFAWLCWLRLRLTSKWDNHTRADGIEASLAVWKAQGRPAAPLFFIDGDHSYESVWSELFAVAVPWGERAAARQLLSVG
jgi:hypothetical protein